MAKKAVQQRNEAISELMAASFRRAQEKGYEEDAGLRPDLERLFSISALGFREILLVIVLAKLRDPTYDPTADFYACNPRPIYEGPVRTALTERSIPRMLSGPLNIAKGSRGINEEWAARRRPKEGGQAVVRLVRRLNSFTPDQLVNFSAWLHDLFLRAARETAALNVVAEPESDPALLYEVCEKLINRAPDAGNTPQRIVGYLLELFHEAFRTGVAVAGHLDRASATSKTSKKPGDILETGSDDQLLAVYEVTVKPFPEQRAQESYEAVAAFSQAHGVDIPEVTVLCRPEDRHPDAVDDSGSVLLLGVYEFKSVRFVFVHLLEWTAAQLLRLPLSGRLRFYEKLHNYISDPNTSPKVKRTWRELRTESGLAGDARGGSKG